MAEVGGEEKNAKAMEVYLVSHLVVSLTPMAQESVEGDEAPLHLRWCHASRHGVRARALLSGTKRTREACPQP